MAVILDPAYAHKGKPVGEVGVKVRLINGEDETLWRVQQLPRERVRIWETEALIVTGAVRTDCAAAGCRASWFAGSRPASSRVCRRAERIRWRYRTFDHRDP